MNEPPVNVGGSSQGSATYVPPDRFLPSLWCLWPKLSGLPHLPRALLRPTEFWKFKSVRATPTIGVRRKSRPCSEASVNKRVRISSDQFFTQEVAHARVANLPHAFSPHTTPARSRSLSRTRTEATSEGQIAVAPLSLITVLSRNLMVAHTVLTHSFNFRRRSAS